MKRTTTTTTKPADIDRKWLEVDATGISLGRLASFVAKKLIGKGKVNYSPHMDGGDYVVVTNADKIKITGKKLRQKVYYSHSGYTGNLNQATLEQLMEDDSRKVIEAAVFGMIPKNKLRPGRMQRLKVARGAEHKHSAQDPKKTEVKQ